jgi:hypothetical protein
VSAYSQGGLTSGRRPVVKIIAESLSQHDEKHVVPTLLSVGKGRKKKSVCLLLWKYTSYKHTNSLMNTKKTGLNSLANKYNYRPDQLPKKRSLRSSKILSRNTLNFVMLN